MNTALIIHLLAIVQHQIFAHPIPAHRGWGGNGGWTVFECFESARAPLHGMVCGTIHVWNHGVVMKWR